MGRFVTETGLKRKTLQEIRVELETALKSVFGPEFETAVDSPNGQLIAQLAQSNADLWELAQEVYDSRDPAQADGVSLDFAAAVNGVYRHGSTACRVDAMLYTLGASANVPAGSKAMRTRGSLLFSLDTAVAISRASCDALFIQDDGSAKNTEYVFHFTFGDVTLENTSPSVTNLAALKADIETAGGTAEYSENGLLVTHENGVGITGNLPDDFIIYAGKSATFTADSVGVQTCEFGELDNIPNSVTGWDKVYNYAAGVPGTATESDAALRIRRALSVRAIKGKGTDPAIAAHLMEEVPGVTYAIVTSNRSNSTDAHGRPSKCFEALVIGGDDDAVAANLWENQPSGIESYGNTSVTFTDGAGDSQLVRFSRPVALYLHVKLTYTLYDEEQAPTADEIKAAIVEWAEREYVLGKDVIPSRVLQGLYSGTTGIGAASVEVSVTNSPDTSPTWTASTIPVAYNCYASLTAARITLVEVT